MLTPAEIEQVLVLGHEIRGFEIKGPGLSTDKHLLARVARAALGLGNLRDGGYVLIGIDDTRQRQMLPGLDAAQLESWVAFDDLSRRLANYADPPLRFERASVSLSNGVTVAVIQVDEFADLPHLCARSYADVLREGALYVRPRRVPETTEFASSVEMREVLDLAVEKALRALVRTTERAGVALVSGDQAPLSQASEKKYEAQRTGAWR